MVTQTNFGLLDGAEIPLFTLSKGDLAVELIPLGAAIRAIRVPDRKGALVDICLGYDTPEAYASLDGCLGGTVGRYANRIAGASLPIGDTLFPLTANEGKNTLHGGEPGFHQVLWDSSAGEDQVTFSRLSPDGENGFPGNLKVEVAYTLTEDALTVSYRAVSDADTAVSLTNHAYFNLAGQGSGPMDGHTLTLLASRYTPFGPGNLPTGEILTVDGTPLDLRAPTVLAGQVFDHNLIPDATPFAKLQSPATGIGVEFSSTLPGVQLYTADFLSPRQGKGGVTYGPRHGICLEPQFFPDSPHFDRFPSPLLKAGEEYHHRISYRFFND